MKTEVYSWRLDPDLKSDLEEQARTEGKTLSSLLEEFAWDGLRARHNGRPNDEAEQAAIRQRAASAIGAVRGTDPARSSRVSEVVREMIARKHAKRSGASHSSD